MLPEFSPHTFKAKLDTGARTSSLHALDIEYYRERKCDWVAFTILPLQDSTRFKKRVVAKLLDKRIVKSSLGHATLRPVIQTKLQMGEHFSEIELNLVNRSPMGFRMLLGRNALRRGFLVRSGKSFLLGEEK